MENNMKRRNANYALLKKTTNFKPVDLPDQSQGLNHPEIDSKIWGKVSSPMLLARLCALFDGLKIEAMGQAAYKCTWMTALEHESGVIITFYDFKGAASVGIQGSCGEITKAGIQDINKLLSVLIDERCPHPYDGCAVGEVA